MASGTGRRTSFTGGVREVRHVTHVDVHETGPAKIKTSTFTISAPVVKPVPKKIKTSMIEWLWLEKKEADALLDIRQTYNIYYTAYLVKANKIEIEINTTVDNSGNLEDSVCNAEDDINQLIKKYCKSPFASRTLDYVPIEPKFKYEVDDTFLCQAPDKRWLIIGPSNTEVNKAERAIKSYIDKQIKGDAKLKDTRKTGAKSGKGDKTRAKSDSCVYIEVDSLTWRYLNHVEKQKVEDIIGPHSITEEQGEHENVILIKMKASAGSENTVLKDLKKRIILTQANTQQTQMEIPDGMSLGDIIDIAQREKTFYIHRESFRFITIIARSGELKKARDKMEKLFKSHQPEEDRSGHTEQPVLLSVKIKDEGRMGGAKASTSFRAKEAEVGKFLGSDETSDDKEAGEWKPHPKFSKRGTKEAGHDISTHPWGEKPRKSHSDPIPNTAETFATFTKDTFMMKSTNIFIHKADITSMKVDAIVNAANNELKHYGGVAYAISKAAGQKLEWDCNDRVRKKGKLDVTEAYTSPGYRLPAKHVIHVVGPMWDAYENKECCKEDMFQTFANALKEAGFRGLSSIAIPAVSSGIYRVPVTIVAQQMYKAVMEHLKSMKTSLREIHLVDFNEDFLWEMQSVFTENFDRDKMSISTQQQQESLGATGTGKKSKPTSASPTTTGTCSICMDDLEDPTALQCSHRFCKECIGNWRREKPTCPECGYIFGEITGNQPKDGKMHVTHSGKLLPGYERDQSCKGSIKIVYEFRDGIQGPEHPNPGKHYHGTARAAYLPDTPEGNDVMRLLQKAFRQRLTFTVGRSTTSGREDQITWNDIHHKTNRDGGPDKFGYPDPSYLQRVKQELADKGIK